MTNINKLLLYLVKRWFTLPLLKSNKIYLMRLLNQLELNDTQIIFPCYDEFGDRIGWKIRNLDGSLLNGLKSLSIKGQKTWLLYDPKDIESSDKILLIEWETDYMVLKILWFKWLLANLWWVASNINKILYICKNKEIISFYDNDKAAKLWNANIVKKGCRLIRIIKFPDWWASDINDLLYHWYWYDKFKSLIDNAKYFNWELEQVKNCKEEYIKLINLYYNKDIEDVHLPFPCKEIENAMNNALQRVVNRKLNWNSNKEWSITQNDIDNVKNIEMKSIIENYWLEINSNNFCKCPFHTDKTSSMKIYLNSFYCYWCWQWWDTIKFIELKDNTSFIDIIKKLKN